MSLQSEPTMSQLRRDIDRGRTGDKVDSPDPAAAPLGTDEEAAGTHEAAGAVARTSGPMILAVLAILAVALTVFAIWATFNRP